MQKAIVPASFLSAAVPAETAVIQYEDFMYVVRENKTAAVAKVSNLYNIFFGAPQVQPEYAGGTGNMLNTGPDYYSSYE